MALEMQSADTSPEVAEMQRRIWQSFSVAKRLSIISEMSENARELTKVGIRRRHPNYDEHQVKQALFRLVHGDDLFRRIFPGVHIEV